MNLIVLQLQKLSVHHNEGNTVSCYTTRHTFSIYLCRFLREISIASVTHPAQSRTGKKTLEYSTPIAASETELNSAKATTSTGEVYVCVVREREWVNHLCRGVVVCCNVGHIRVPRFREPNRVFCADRWCRILGIVPVYTENKIKSTNWGNREFKCVCWDVFNFKFINCSLEVITHVSLNSENRGS